MAAKQPLVVIVGETASGKSALAMKIAKKFDGEIICADSRTIYKGMDIGTAKPSAQQRRQVKHYLLDVVEPDEKFSVVDFKKLANQAIEEIRAKGKLPIMVGGSGLYIDSVLFDYGFADPAHAKKRDEKNPRHLAKIVKSNKNKLRGDAIVIGTLVNGEKLRKQIAKRVESMVNAGFVDEVSSLLEDYDWQLSAFLAPSYKAFIPYVNGKTTLDEAKNEFIQKDLALAKKQRTWFKRNKSIHWANSRREAVAFVTTELNK